MYMIMALRELCDFQEDCRGSANITSDYHLINDNCLSL